jgi:hypothetical protein
VRRGRRRQPSMTTHDYQVASLESEMEATIRELVAHKHGMMWHIRRSDHAPETENMPDLLILLPGRLFLVELKSQDRPLTPGQVAVKALMSTITDVTCGVVRPDPRPGEMSFDALLAVIAEATC